MLKHFYQRVILAYPKIILFALFALVVALGFGATQLEVDASAETLLLEDDADLKFFREVSSRYPSGLNMLIVSFAPKDDLLSNSSLDAINKISEDFRKLSWVDSVMSIADVPLLENGSGSIKDLVNQVVTLKSENVDFQKARDEFLTSPMYSQNLVSKDLKTTAILVMIKDDLVYQKLLDKRNAARIKANQKDAAKEDREALKQISSEFKTYRDDLRLRELNAIGEARSILENNKNLGTLFLSGVNMIAVDMIVFVKSDLKYFGVALFLLFAFALWVIFRQTRWIALPLLICIFSIVSTAGILGIFGWEVTVISSNFIALQLILTMSLILHLTVRYRELAVKYPNVPQKQIVLLSVLSKIKPSFFAVFTTIIGFLSLILSEIRPVITFGWMMASGITISLLIVFVALPVILMILPKKPLYTKFEKDFALSGFCAQIVHKYGNFIIVACIIIMIFAFFGIQKIKVENSFISYFKSSTDIYKGMKNIDQNLGGTTPMDVIVKFNDAATKSMTENEIAEDDFEAEFTQDATDEKYWFTPQKMDIAMKLHEYFENLEHMGKVQSLATMLQIGKKLNNNKSLDSFELALIYSHLPEQYKDIVLTPFVNMEHNELRFTMRLIDSDPTLQRNELLQKIQNDLGEIIGKDVGTYRLSGAMVLYNNMLQSLFKSQILTLGSVVITFLIMFWPLFGSFRAAVIGIMTNIVPMSAVFGFMGYAGIPLDMMTITIAAISIGMGVDNVIHYIHRFKSELAKSKDYTIAMFNSHDSIGYAMYYTAMATILGFGVLATSNFIPTIYFGILTVAVMTMVFFGAILLLPKLLLIFKPFKVIK